MTSPSLEHLVQEKTRAQCQCQGRVAMTKHECDLGWAIIGKLWIVRGSSTVYKDKRTTTTPGWLGLQKARGLKIHLLHLLLCVSCHQFHWLVQPSCHHFLFCFQIVSRKFSDQFDMTVTALEVKSSVAWNAFCFRKYFSQQWHFIKVRFFSDVS